MFFANYQFRKVDKIVYLQTTTTNKSIKNIKKDNNKRQGEPLQLVLKVHSKKEPMVCINNWEK
jgi:hypothetical protein